MGSERTDFFRPEFSKGCSSILSEFVELFCSLENIQTNKQIGNILKNSSFCVILFLDCGLQWYEIFSCVFKEERVVLKQCSYIVLTS